MRQSLFYQQSRLNWLRAGRRDLAAEIVLPSRAPQKKIARKELPKLRHCLID
jgi:hypothetical protein